MNRWAGQMLCRQRTTSPIYLGTARFNFLGCLWGFRLKQPDEYPAVLSFPCTNPTLVFAAHLLFFVFRVVTGRSFGPRYLAGFVPGHLKFVLQSFWGKGNKHDCKYTTYAMGGRHICRFRKGER